MARLNRRSGARSATQRTPSFWRSRLPRIVATSVVFLLALSGISAAVGTAEYKHYDAQITRDPGVLASKDPAIRNAPKQLHAENYLVIGSDSRAGTKEAAAIPSQRSDTTMIVHLSPNHKDATVISIPRDSYVTIPSCTDSKGVVHPQHHDLFNAAFGVGGAACTIKTVQRLTGIAIKHYVEIDFEGFRNIIDALGSVTICSPTAVTITEGVHLTLKAGKNKLNGADALRYVRLRHIGTGSDLERIKRQQRFLGAVLREAQGGGLLSSPAKLNSFLNAATKAVTVDEHTHIGDLRTLFDSLRGLDPRHVTFYTPPIASDHYDPQHPSSPTGAHVLLDERKGRVLYDQIINDAKIAPAATATKKAPPVPATLSVKPSAITVAVTNGTQAVGLAGKVQTALTRLGFKPGTQYKKPQGATATIVQYAASQEAAALTVAAALPNSTLKLDASHTGPIDVLVGSGYRGVRAVTAGEPTPTWVKASAATATPAPATGRVPGGISAADKTCTNTG